MLSRKTARDEEHAKVRHSHWQTWARSENPRVSHAEKRRGHSSSPPLPSPPPSSLLLPPPPSSSLLLPPPSSLLLPPSSLLPPHSPPPSSLLPPSACRSALDCELNDEFSAGIGRVGSLSLWCRAKLRTERCTLCGDRACRIALAVVPCPSLSSPVNPLRGSGVSDRSRCGAVPILELAGEVCAGIGRVGSLSLWCRAHP